LKYKKLGWFRVVEVRLGSTIRLLEEKKGSGMLVTFIKE